MTAPRWVKAVLIAAGLTLAVVLITPRIAEIPSGVAALGAARPGWVAAAAATAAAAYVATALALQAAVRDRLPLWRTTQVQLAGATAAIVAPAGLGGMALNVRFLERSGLGRADAVAAVGLHRVAGFAVHAATLVVLAPWLLGQGGIIGSPGLPRAGLSVAVAVGAAVTAGLALARGQVPAVGRLIQRLSTAAGTMLRGARVVSGCWRRIVGLIGGSLLLSAARALTLAACLQAFGVSVPLVTVAAVYFGAEALGALGGTPGGLGLLDSSLIAGLATVGVVAGSAIAAVLIFRLLTFWLPTAPGALALRRLRRVAAI